MWFDVHAAMAEIRGRKTQPFNRPTVATIATIATTEAYGTGFVAVVAIVAAPERNNLETASATSDPQLYLAHLLATGPSTYGAVAVDLDWPATRAWRAEAQLRAEGAVHYADNGKTHPTPI